MNPLFGKTLTLIVILVFALTGLNSCMTSTSLEVLQPAAFAVPGHISTLATVNRTRPVKKVGNAIEGLFTGEAIGQDKSGARRATEGLSDALKNTPRFDVVFTGIEMTGKGAFEFPAPLDWRLIDSICDAFNADALAVIEKFDSDISRNTSSQQRESKDKDGNVQRWTEYRVEMATRVKLGWRMYDPQERVIIDEFEVWEEIGWDGSGRSENAAAAGLPDRVSMVNEVSYAAGRKYGMRIAPSWIRVRRQYYPKAKGDSQLEADMAEAARFARIGKFAEAAVLWKPIAEDGTNPKAAGKAAYNMALAAEWEGKLDIALNWADKAYVQYGNKQARDYTTILRNRINDQLRLQEQMK